MLEIVNLIFLQIVSSQILPENVTQSFITSPLGQQLLDAIDTEMLHLVQVSNTLLT